MLVRVTGVGVEALRAALYADLRNLTDRYQLSQGVVDGRPGDLGQALGRAGVHLVGGEVHVIAA